MNMKLAVNRLFMIILPEKKKSIGISTEYKKLVKSVNKMEPQLLNPYNDKIRTQLGKSLLELKEALSQFNSVYKQTICTPDKTRLNIFKLKLLNILMKPSSVSTEMLNFLIIHDEVLKKNNQVANPEDIIFNKRIAYFQSKNIKLAQKAYDTNLQLALLAGFDFDSFINLFQPQLNVESGKTTLKPCKGKDALPYLKDLYYLISEIKTDKKTLQLFNLMITLQDQTQIKQNEVIRIYALIQTINESIFSESNLASIIKVISGDPYIELKKIIYKNNNDLLALGKEITHQYIIDKERFIKEESEHELKKSLQSLFGNIPLETLKGYTSADSAELMKLQLPSYNFITALRILKTFFEKFYFAFMSDTFNEIFNEFEYNSDEFKENIVRHHTSLGLIGASISKFEEDLISPKYWDLNPYFKKYEEATITDKEIKEAVVLVNNVNKNADRIIQLIFQEFTEILSLNDEIIHDIDRMESKILTNSLFMTRNKSEMIYHYKKCVAAIKKCSNILNKYSVNIEDIKSKM